MMRPQAFKFIMALGLVLGFALFAGSSAKATEPKFGYIDLQKAIQQTSAGKAAKKQLETEFNSKKEELAKKEKDLKQMNEDLEKKKNVLSEEVREKKQAELQQEMMKYRDLVGQSQMNIQKKEQDLTKPILEKLQGLVDKMARDGGYSMIFEKSEQSVLWARKDLDLTDSLVKAFEAAK